DLADRRRARGVIRLELRELPLQRPDLRAEPVVLRVQVADERGQVLGGTALQRGAGRLGAELDDDEQAEQERDGRDRELVAALAHRRRGRRRTGRAAGRQAPHGTASCGDGPAGSVGVCDATARDSLSVTLPANAGTSTFAGSAHETP